MLAKGFSEFGGRSNAHAAVRPYFAVVPLPCSYLCLGMIHEREPVFVDALGYSDFDGFLAAVDLPPISVPTGFKQSSWFRA